MLEEDAEKQKKEGFPIHDPKQKQKQIFKEHIGKETFIPETFIIKL